MEDCNSNNNNNRSSSAPSSPATQKKGLAFSSKDSHSSAERFGITDHPTLPGPTDSQDPSYSSNQRNNIAETRNHKTSPSVLPKTRALYPQVGWTAYSAACHSNNMLSSFIREHQQHSMLPYPAAVNMALFHNSHHHHHQALMQAALAATNPMMFLAHPLNTKHKEELATQSLLLLAGKRRASESMAASVRDLRAKTPVAASSDIKPLQRSATLPPLAPALTEKPSPPAAPRPKTPPSKPPKKVPVSKARRSVKKQPSSPSTARRKNRSFRVAQTIAESVQRGDGPQQEDQISEPSFKDVLSGRGNGVASHPGNLAFRKYIKHYRLAYQGADRKHKSRITTLIIQAIKESGGRFLSPVVEEGASTNKNTVWQVLDNDKAWEKTSQALREK